MYKLWSDLFAILATPIIRQELIKTKGLGTADNLDLGPEFCWELLNDVKALEVPTGDTKASFYLSWEIRKLQSLQ